jgi:hypothetical protein
MPNGDPSMVSEWVWDYADPNSGDNDDSTAVAEHIYATPQLYNNVNLRVKSNYGCPSTTPATQTLNIGGIPTVSFSTRGVAAGDRFSFDPTNSEVAGSDPINSYLWDFGDGGTLPQTGPSERIARHTYASAGARIVRLTMSTLQGCTNFAERPIYVLPNATASDTQVYQENFDNNSWPVLPPIGSSWIHQNGTWTTPSYGNDEKSSIYSPALNIGGLSRPIISFKTLVDMAKNDGVVLQWSSDSLNITDPAKIWIAVGQEESGLNWYNASSIASKPGDQAIGDYGWTLEENTIPAWKDSKHTLAALPLSNFDRYVFRFSFASNQDGNTTGGFSVDELRIGSGTRTVLIENFTNTASNSVKEPNDFFRLFPDDDPTDEATGEVGDEFVKIDYHIALSNNPGASTDPFNEENPSDPGARALFYNISTVPQTRMDGTIGLEGGPFESWAAPELSRHLLDLAAASILANVTVDDGELTITGSFTPLNALPGTTNLYVAVIEENVTLDLNPSLAGRIGSGETEFGYVLRKMLPNGAGQKFIDLAQGAAQTFEFTWSNPRLLEPADDIAVVIFLQAEEPDQLGVRQVYQSYMVRTADPGTVTGIDPEKAFALYPNPADEGFTLELAQPVKERTPLQLYDQMGKVVKTTFLEKGESKKTVSTSNYAAGVYLLQLSSKENPIRKKVMIVHKN